MILHKQPNGPDLMIVALEPSPEETVLAAKARAVVEGREIATRLMRALPPDTLDACLSALLAEHLISGSSQLAPPSAPAVAHAKEAAGGHTTAG